MKIRTQHLFILSLAIFSLLTTNIGLADKSGKTNSANKSIKSNVQNTKIRIGWVYAMANAPVIIAEKKGYFLEQGLSVSLKSYKVGSDLYKDIEAGRLDIAYIGVPPIFHWHTKGLKNKIIAKVNYGQSAIIVHNNSNIKKIEDLRGLKLAGYQTGSGMDVLLRGYVLNDLAGINPRSDVNIIAISPEKMGPAIEQKMVAAAFSWEPFTSEYLLRGNTKIILDVNKKIPRYPWYVIMATPEAIKNKRAGIVKVLKAHQKAIQYINSTPTAGNSIIIQTFGLAPIKDNKKNIHTAADIIKSAKQRLGWQARLSRSDIRFMQRLVNYSYKLGYIKTKIDINDIIDISLLFEAVIN